MITPEMMPALASGMTMDTKVRHLAGAQIETGLQVGAVHPVQRRIERQHHEGQDDIDQPEDHGEIVVEQNQRLEGVAEQFQISQAHQCQGCVPLFPEPFQGEIDEARVSAETAIKA